MKSSNGLEFKPVKRGVARWGGPSLWILIFGNVVSIVLAIYQHWPMTEVMWIYWVQSVTIGVMNYLRMMSLKDFTTKGLTSNGRPVSESTAGKITVAHFFLLHYGFFHFGYFMFLIQEMPFDKIPHDDFLLLLLAASSFIVAHLYPLMTDLSDDFRDERPNLGTLMFYPYMRIIPMHLAIIFGSGTTGFGTIFFMGLKMLADIGMYLVEQHLFKPKETAGSSFVLKD